MICFSNFVWSLTFSSLHSMFHIYIFKAKTYLLLLLSFIWKAIRLSIKRAATSKQSFIALKPHFCVHIWCCHKALMKNIQCFQSIRLINASQNTTWYDLIWFDLKSVIHIHDNYGYMFVIVNEAIFEVQCFGLMVFLLLLRAVLKLFQFHFLQ